MTLATGALAGVEALVRWDHPERGVDHARTDFIEIAEETGSILPIGRWVLREACREAARWLRRAVASAPDSFLSVNVSAREIQQLGFVDVGRGRRSASPGSIRTASCSRSPRRRC